MSAPDTNLEKQRRRHWGPIAGITIGVLFAGALFAAFVGYVWEPAADSVVPAVTADS